MHLPIVKKRNSIPNNKAPIVCTKAQIVSKKVPKHNCKQRSSIASRKLPNVSKKLHLFQNHYIHEIIILELFLE